MDEVRSLLSERLQEASHLNPQPLDPLPPPQDIQKPPDDAQEKRTDSPQILPADQATFALDAVNNEVKNYNLGSTVEPMTTKGVEDNKSLYPHGMDNLRTFLPHTEEGIKSYLQERVESHREQERQEVKKSQERLERGRQNGKSQLTNPRHDATLVHAIRELHEEQFGLDAVLLAEGGHVGAHCAVLAAASPFLKTLLLTTPDHPAIISVAGTPLATVQGIVTCLYTGTIPPGASIYQLIEVANLLRMDDLSLVLRQTYLAQGGSLLDLARLPSALNATLSATLSSAPNTSHSDLNNTNSDPSYTQSDPKNTHSDTNHSHSDPSHTQSDPNHSQSDPSHSHSDPQQNHTDPYHSQGESRHDRPDKRRGGSRLDQILYQKLNVNHLAPLDLPTPGPPPIPTAPLPEPPAPPLAPDPRGGILGELLTKADPMRNMFAPTSYPFPDLGLNPTMPTAPKPLNLSKDSKPDPPPTYPPYLPAAQPSLNLGALTSLPCSMPGLLAPLAPSPMLPSALASHLTSSALASLGVQQSIEAAQNKMISNNSSKSRSSGHRSSSSSSRSSSSRHSSNSRKSSHHPSLPLLYSLRTNMQDITKDPNDNLKLHPPLPSLSSSFDIHNNLSALSSSASLQNLANLHNLSNLQNYSALFPFLAPPAPPDNIMKDSHLLNNQPKDINMHVLPTESRVLSPNVTSTEEHGVLNLSAAAGPHPDSPKPLGSEDRHGAMDTNHIMEKCANGEGCDDETRRQTPPKHDLTSSLSTLQSIKAESESLAHRLGHFGNGLDSRTLPLLLMGRMGLGGVYPGDHLHRSLDASLDTLSFNKQDPPPLVSLGGIDDDDDGGIEVIEEIPARSGHLQIRKNLFPPGHLSNIGRKRKGCGECEGCQVVEDCTHCRFCRDKAKFGGPNRLKQVCVYKRCVLAETEPEDFKKRRKSNSKKSRVKCGGCDGCQRTLDCNECYACLHNAAAQPPARRKICEMRVCEQQQMEEVRAALSTAGEPSPYSTDSLLLAETLSISSGASSPTPDQPSTHNDKMKLMRKMLKKKFAQPYSRVSPSKVRTKYYCGECPGCQTTTPCGHCLYCEDMPKFGGPGRYRQKCVKQLCVYHPRLQALKLSNRSKLTYDEQHISQETLTHLGNAIPSTVAPEGMELGCRDNMEELDSLGDEGEDVTEGEDSNAPLHVQTAMEELRAIKSEPRIKLETALSPSTILPPTMIPSTIIPSSLVPSTAIPSVIPSPGGVGIPATAPLPNFSVPGSQGSIVPPSAESITQPLSPKPPIGLPPIPPKDKPIEVIPICDDSDSTCNGNSNGNSTISSEGVNLVTATTTITTSAILPTSLTTIVTTPLIHTPAPSHSPIPACAPAPQSPVPAQTPTYCESPVRSFSPASQPVRTFSPASQPVRTFSPAPQPVHTFSPASQPVRSFSPASQPIRTLSPASQPVRSFSPGPQPVRTFSPASQPQTSAHIPTSTSPTPIDVPATSPVPPHIPTPSSVPNLIPTSSSPVPTHIGLPTMSPVLTNTPVSSPLNVQIPTSASPIPPTSVSPVPMPAVPIASSPTPTHIPTSSVPSYLPTPASPISTPQSHPIIHLATMPSPTPAHIPITETPSTHILPPTEPSTEPPTYIPTTELPTHFPTPSLDPEPTPKSVEEVNDVNPGNEEDENDRGEDYDDKEDYAALNSDASDGPSPTSHLNKARGKNCAKGRGRGRGKDIDDSVETRRKKAIRRGLRRRKTRFNLEPDDNSDFEEMLKEFEATDSEMKQLRDSQKNMLPPNSQPERIPLDQRGGHAPRPISIRGGREAGRGSRFHLTTSNRTVGQPQNTESNSKADIFEFQEPQDFSGDVADLRREALGLRRGGLLMRRDNTESRRLGTEMRMPVNETRKSIELRLDEAETKKLGSEVSAEAKKLPEIETKMEGVEVRKGVETRRGSETRKSVETRREVQEGVSLKHNGPYAGFPEEELSQGSRDVNENVGGISEAASA